MSSLILIQSQKLYRSYKNHFVNEFVEPLRVYSWAAFFTYGYRYRNSLKFQLSRSDEVKFDSKAFKFEKRNVNGLITKQKTSDGQSKILLIVV